MVPGRQIARVLRVFRIVFTAVVLLLSLACAAQAPAGGAYRGVYGATYVPFTGTWPTWRLAYTGFVFQMPGTPSLTRSSERDDATLTADLVLPGPATFSVMAYSHEEEELANVDWLLAEATRMSAQRLGATVRSQRPLEVAGYPGLEVVIDMGQYGTTGVVQFYVGRTATYSAAVIFPQSIEPSIAQDVARFFSSVRLDDGDRPDRVGQGQLEAGAQAWAYRSPHAADFAARMPGRPARSELDVQTSNGTKHALSYVVAAPDGSRSYRVTLTQYGDRPPRGQLDGLRDTLVRQGYRLQSERALQVQGYAGREYVLSAPNGATTLVVRLFTTESRLYDVRATLPANTQPASDPDTVRFLDSFRVL